MTIDQDQFCTMLKVLSNPHRFRILQRLLEGEVSVGELELTLNLKQPNLSHELRKLRQHNIVQTRRQSKVVFYSISDTPIRNLIENVVALFLSQENGNASWAPTNDNPPQIPDNPLYEFDQLATPTLCSPFPHTTQGECGYFSIAKPR